jgi:hypothetical protein
MVLKQLMMMTSLMRLSRRKRETKATEEVEEEPTEAEEVAAVEEVASPEMARNIRMEMMNKKEIVRRIEIEVNSKKNQEVIDHKENRDPPLKIKREALNTKMLTHQRKPRKLHQLSNQTLLPRSHRLKLPSTDGEVVQPSSEFKF